MIFYLFSIFLIFVENYEYVSSLSCKIIERDKNQEAYFNDAEYYVSIKIPETLINSKDGKGYIYKSNLDKNQK